MTHHNTLVDEAGESPSIVPSVEDTFQIGRTPRGWEAEVDLEEQTVNFGIGRKE